MLTDDFSPAGRAVRFQVEQLERAVAKAGARGLRAGEIAARLSWPLDSVQHWLARALDEGELTVAADEEQTADPRYVTVANLSAEATE